MKREIKFRAWIPDTGWLSDGFSIAMDGTEWYDDNGHSWQLSQLELMQYTGLLDRRGKEIYEGDIVKTDARQGNMKVIYFDAYASFMLEIDGLLYPLNEGADIEVIGNIYEHDYLLNK